MSTFGHQARTTRAQKVAWLLAQPHLYDGFPNVGDGLGDYYLTIKHSLWGPRLRQIAQMMVEEGLYSPLTLPGDVHYGVWRCIVRARKEQS